MLFTADRPRELPRPLALLLAFVMLLAVAIPSALGVGASPAAAADEPAPEFRVLVFSKTGGFVHPAIGLAKTAIQKLGTENNFEVVTDDDAGRFTEAGLAGFDAVIFNSTTGDVLDNAQQAAFEGYIQAGGGFVGLHSATDTEYDWPWYGKLVGGYFDGHPAQQPATIKVEDHVHPSTAHLGDTWPRFDEWYNIRDQDRDKVHVLLSLDEKTYSGGTDGAEHPISWCQDYDGGRSWYTGLGHTDESYTNTDFLTHLLGGIETASGNQAASCGASQSSSFELVPLDENTSNPMLLDIAEDGTVFYAERDGRLRRIDPVTNQTSNAMTLPVTTANEDGLLGIVLDPDFASNGWIYAYWGPANVGSDGPHNRLSRFDYDFATKTAAASTEKVLLKVTTQRNTCCHAGGDMEFDNDGNLILVTGDNTNPFESTGFAPIDERAGKQDYDAQRTSANTNDLRGKVIRITPTAAGSYTVPAGNLFAAGTDKTRPEIYGMGFRNPFRIGVDAKTNNIMVADYGPDSSTSSPTRGPDGRVEWNLLTQAGNFGWPYCHSNTCYNDYNFATDTSGAVFSATAPINNSPNNTGLTALPPVTMATVWYGYGTNPLFPEIGGGGAPMAGPVYRYDKDLDSDVKWPEYWDGKAIFGEWNQGKLYSFQLDQETGDNLVDINRILPGIFDNAKGWARPMDFEFGPDGALYIIDWGSGFGGDNDDSGVYKVNYTKGNPSPIAKASSDVTDGANPLTVAFSSEGTRHPLSKDFTLSWNFGDGTAVSTDANPTHTYTVNGDYTAQLTVTDEDGRTAVDNVRIVVGNEKPTITIDFPDDGGFFEFGDQVKYEVHVDDPDGEIDCDKVTLSPALGHDSHGHPMEVLEGCEGTFQTSRDDGHGAEANLFWIVDAKYTDDGGNAGVPLTVFDTQILQPKRLQSEFFTSTGRIGGTGGADDGVKIETTSDTAGGGKNIGFLEVSDWWAHDPVSLRNIDTLSLRAANPNQVGNISVRWGAPDGQELGVIHVEPTGAWQTYQDFSLTLDPATKPEGSSGLYFVLVSGGGVNVNWLQVAGAGVTSNVRPELALEADPLIGAAPLTVNAIATATDPDGETSNIVYTWNQGLGDGLEAGTATDSFEYTTPGTYRLTVRATDEAGAYAEKYVSVTVTDPSSGLCLEGRSDGFTGTSLDEDRWDTIIRRNQLFSVANGHLTIPASKTDLYGAGGTAENIVLQDAPNGAWTATTKITLTARTQYQQAGLILYGDDDNYAKIMLQGRGTGNESASRIFQFIREVGGTPITEASDSPALGASFPDTFYVRLTSDGTSVGSSYSADGTTFTPLSTPKAIAGITNPKIGLTAFANDGSNAAVIDAKFDWFSITPDDTAESSGPDDEFDGTSLNSCRWSVDNEDVTGYRVADGKLEIDTSRLDIYGPDTGATNFVLQPAPSGNWVIETKVDGSAFDRQYQQGGLIVRTDDDNYVKFDIVSTNAAGSTVTRNLEMRSEIGGVVQDPQPNANSAADGVQYLRLGKTGNVITGWYSSDGVEWTQVPDTLTNASLANAKVGVFALGNSAQTAAATAKFDYFRVVPPAAPLEVTATVAPAAPGASGWYTGDVTVTLTAEGGVGDVYRSYSLDGGTYQEYTTPVVVSANGVHSLKYKASASGENTEEAEVEFKIDSEAPVSSATVDEEDRTVVLRSADAASGVDSIEYSTDAGENWIDYSGAIEIGAAAETVAYRATDKAGNVEAINRARVPAAGIELAATSTAGIVSATTQRYGAASTVTVRVTGVGGTPTGVVDVVVNDVVIATGKLANGRLTVAVPKRSLLPGVHELEFRYAGDAVFSASADAASVKVLKALSSTTSSFAKSTVKRSGADPKLTVKVTSVAPVTGTVTVKEGSKTIKSKVTLKNGKAIITITSPLKVGKHTFSVTYNGSPTVSTSKDASVKLRVKK